MQIIYRTAVALGVSALVYFHASSVAPGAALILTGATFVVLGLLLFLDKFLELDAELVFCTAVGILAGLVVGFLVQRALESMGVQITDYAGFVHLVSIALFGYVGVMFARHPGLKIFGGGAGFAQDSEGSHSKEKILDTSVIIDGRILDIAETHFIDGPFIIPNFVLREIQLISDSPDPIKRNRGRRGLDMLNKLQQHGSVKVKISYVDYSDTREVDAKLVKLARETGGKLVTNDFNLNKVAELQGVQVLNLNNLTNALKPVVLPGEDIYIDVIKEGKDENQGIGYLEDGTMVVIENGGMLLGKTVQVNVTSIIQTAAGKMIFTRATGRERESSVSGDSGAARKRNGRRGRRGRGGSGGGGSDRGDRGDRPERSDRGGNNERGSSEGPEDSPEPGNEREEVPQGRGRRR